MGKQIRWMWIATVAALACGDQDDGVGHGRVTVVVDAEDSIVEGVSAGTAVEQIADGWQVEFDRYIVAIGHVTLTLARNSEIVREIEESFAVDLATLNSQGLALWEFEDLAAETWQIEYATVAAGDADPIRHRSVSERDHAALIEQDATYLIAGRLSADEGMSCPPPAHADPGDATPTGERDTGEPCYDNPSIEFSWLVPAETTYGPCEVDGVEGVSVPEGGTRSVALTLHGDHIFFNGFPGGSEGGITRLAQWLADSDLNLDGEVTREELEAISPADLAELDERYNLDAPFEDLLPLDDLWTYVRAQLRTQGHFEGEGECALGGSAHDHDH